jgi:hypothetical protein
MQLIIAGNEKLHSAFKHCLYQPFAHRTEARKRKALFS